MLLFFYLQRKLNHSHILLCNDVENVLTIITENNKNDTVKFRDFHMKTMQPHISIN